MPLLSFKHAHTGGDGLREEEIGEEEVEEEEKKRLKLIEFLKKESVIEPTNFPKIPFIFLYSTCTKKAQPDDGTHTTKQHTLDVLSA